MSKLRRAMVSLTAVALLGAGGSATAGAAGLTVAAALKAHGSRGSQSPVIKQLQHLTVNTPAQAKKVIPDLNAAAQKLNHAAAVVSTATTSTARQPMGKKDWVAGVRDLARGFSLLVVALTDIEHGHKAAAKAEAVAAQKLVTTGNAIGARGDRLLGLPTSD